MSIQAKMKEVQHSSDEAGDEEMTMSEVVE